MLINSLNSRALARVSTGKSDRGFTLLEMVVAMGILTVGLLAVASTIGYALLVSNSGRGITNTKLLIVSVLEQVETLRNTEALTFDQISNVVLDGNGVPTGPGVFPTGFQPISTNPGRDGIFGTGDDLLDANGIPDPTLARPGVSRQILITSLSPQLKRVQVTLRYSPKGGETKELVGFSYLNNNAQSNYQ
jgi:prepilin-type N-terminal cleavage/methylation domain-containing protein